MYTCNLGHSVTLFVTDSGLQSDTSFCTQICTFLQFNMVIYNECVVYNSVLMHFDMEKLNPPNIPFTSTCSGKEHVSLGHASNRPNRVRGC